MVAPTVTRPSLLAGYEKAKPSPEPSLATNLAKSFEVYIATQRGQLGPSLARFYRPAHLHEDATLQREASALGFRLLGSELCFSVETSELLEFAEFHMLLHFLHEAFQPAPCATTSSLSSSLTCDAIFEADPWQRSTAVWLADAAALCVALGVGKVTRIRLSYRYQARLAPGQQPPDERLLAVLLRCPGAASIGPITMPKLPSEPETPLLPPAVVSMERAEQALRALCALSAGETAEAADPSEAPEEPEAQAKRNMPLVWERVFHDELRRNSTFRRVRSWCHAEAGAD
eukprot:CAMPEP_0179019518 /NCGR_PEP_ID=MMETSP0796-20121207/4907_1 /TAXON_ID=73915 /ORGANISM="Pyrodinium bahamense, Strain pbaha01" /LENGTH=287 /DNA_ID=CAMNT_0020715303 /DNA_START=50 /DNA_END=913 /DNA_ORIENTATION=+